MAENSSFFSSLSFLAQHNISIYVIAQDAPQRHVFPAIKEHVGDLQPKPLSHLRDQRTEYRTHESSSTHINGGLGPATRCLPSS